MGMNLKNVQPRATLSKNNRIMCFLLVFMLIVGGQFYIFKSGIPQPYTIPMLLLVFLITFFRKGKLYISAHDVTAISIIALAFYILLVSFSAALITSETIYVKFSLYIIFDVIVFFSVYNYLLICDQSGEKIAIFAILAITLLFFFSITGLGRTYAGTRYMGFFNDPNQMSYWTLCMYCVAVSFLERKIILLFYATIICGAILIAGASRASALGFSVAALGVILRESGFSQNHSSNKKIIGISILLIVALFVVLPIVAYSQSYFMASDIGSRFSSTKESSQLQIRGFFLPLEYPQYLLFGAGKGAFNAFDRSNEIHSTWVGILFYFGIIGFFLHVTAFLSTFRKHTLSYKLIYLGPFIYGIFTFGIRTPVFWIFWACLYYIAYNYEQIHTSKTRMK